MSLTITGRREGLDQDEVVPPVELGLEVLAGDERNLRVRHLASLGKSDR